MGIPTPEPGLVVGYSYLWHHEHRAGVEEGRKARPCVIVLSVTRGKGDKTIVTVLPITHAAPDNLPAAVEIPLKVKRHLGLDDRRSWVIIDEANEFVWPGHDLRKIPGADGFELGFLPPRLFNQVLEKAIALRAAGRARLTRRT